MRCFIIKILLILGFTLVAHGREGVNWSKTGWIFLGWILSPLIREMKKKRNYYNHNLIIFNIAWFKFLSPLFIQFNVQPFIDSSILHSHLLPSCEIQEPIWCHQQDLLQLHHWPHLQHQLCYCSYNWRLFLQSCWSNHNMDRFFSAWKIREEGWRLKVAEVNLYTFLSITNFSRKQICLSNLHLAFHS